MVSRVKKSVAKSPVAWARRKVSHPVSARRGGGPRTAAGQDPSNGAGAHVVSESGEFAVDPAVAPGGVFLGQALHQRADLPGDRWAA